MLKVDSVGKEEARGVEATDRSQERAAAEEGPEMGSTDSPGSAHSGSSSCGLVTSLFPNSCRGRAESFARRLHRRLTSLGGDGSTAEDEALASSEGRVKVTETSWLHGPSGQRTSSGLPANQSASLLSSVQVEDRVLDRQPHHSPESDIYYDFDLDPEEHRDSDASGSPAEMANPDDLASILVNPGVLQSSHHEACHCYPGSLRPPESGGQDPESGCVFSSPMAGTSPDTENSEIYFDPESSDTFLDPQGTSTESEANVANGLGPRAPRLPSRRREAKKPSEECSSESSTSSCNPGTLEDPRPPGLPAMCSSEESLNGRSSLETTSPSHESLWSTFEDSTVSLQDETPSRSSCAPIDAQTRLSKSHSDSEIPANPRDVVGDEVERPSAAVEENCLTNGVVDADESPDRDETTYSTSIDIPGSMVLECPAGRGVAALEESLRNEVNLRIGCDNGDDMARLMERLACSPNVDTQGHDDLEIDVKVKAEVDDADEEATQDDDEKEDEDNEEEEEDRPQRVRRCSSLKTGKTPPGTPGRKKIVRFADVLGLDLADVRTFLDEIPKIPNSAYSDLIYDEVFQKDSSPVNFWGTGPATFTTPLYAATMPKGPMTGAKLDRSLVPLFQQPGGLANFIDLVRERLVCLENVVVQDPVTMCLHGTVRVRNLDFHKSVHVRYSLDSWQNFSDLQAVYAVNSCDGFSDKFTFVLYCHTLKIGQRLELAVRFQCKGSQYWDNNDGANYCFQCLPATPSSPGYIPITAQSPNSGSRGNRDWSPAFY